MAPIDSGTTRDEQPPVPAGWGLHGSRPEDYEIGTTAGSSDGTVAASLRARSASTGFGTLMQTFDAAARRGTRQRLRARVRSEDVTGWAGLWMRVDGPARGVLAFDNMESRPIAGTTAWTAYDVVLDVAPDARRVAFGILLSGAGCVWIEGVELAPVGDDVPTTGTEQRLPDAPVNLDFSEKE